MFRIAIKEDCDSIADIYNHYLGIATMDMEEKDGAYYRETLSRQDDREELWVSVDTPLIVWGVIKRYSDRIGYRFTAETSVYCHHQYLRQGLGTTMKRHLIERCRALGYHHLIARIQSDNIGSIHYNEKLGYRIVGIQREVGYTYGKWRNVTIMELLL